MNLITEMTKVKQRLSEGVIARGPVKLLGGLVAGALILTGTGLYFGPAQFHDEHSPVEGVAPEKISITVQNRYPGGISASELSRNTFRIREEQRAADRQDDLRDMIQYWNQLKQSAAPH